MSGQDAGVKTRAQLLLGMVAFGSATPVSKIVTGAIPVFAASLARVALGALVLLPFAVRRGLRVRGLDRAAWAQIIAIAVVGVFGFSALMLYGMRFVPGVVGAIVMSTTPAVTAGASMAFMGDRVTRGKLAAVGLAVLGVGIVQIAGQDAGAEGSRLLFGAAIVFGAVCCEAVYTLVGKKASEHSDPIVVAFLASALAVPLFVPFALWQLPQVDWSGIGAAPLAALLWYGVGTLALGSWLWYSGVSATEGSVAAGFMGVMPVSALVLSYLLLGESFAWSHAVGFAVVLCGVLVISREHARHDP